MRGAWVAAGLLAAGVARAEAPPPVFVGPSQPSFSDWQTCADRLTGESEQVRQQALAGLRAIPGLPRQLEQALATPARGLALDTIAALELSELLPSLVRASGVDGDRDGQIHLTLNSLISPETRGPLVALYRAQLEAPRGRRPSAASRVAILDGLSLMSEPLSAVRVRHLLEDPSYEVRSAALLYAEGLTRKLRTSRYFPLIKGCLTAHPRELRAQAKLALGSLRTDAPELAGPPRPEESGALDPGRSPVGSGGAVDSLVPSAELLSSPDDPTLSAFEPEDVDPIDDPLLPKLAKGYGKGMDLFTQNRKFLRSIEDHDPHGCRDQYRGFYRRGHADLRVIFGYKDARPARFVGDRYERAALVEDLTRPCPGDYHACGFRRSKDSADLLLRKVPGPGGRRVQVELHVADSSAGPDDELNRRSPEQVVKSRATRHEFLEGLEEADAVLYLGHSRGGGGPDFSPPRLRTDHHVDYAWYRAHPRSFEEMQRALAHAWHRPRMVGLLSCFSDKLFSGRLHSRYPGMGLITSPGWAYSDDEVTQAVAALNSLLGMWCGQDFERGLDPAAPLRVQGFFAAGARPRG